MDDRGNQEIRMRITAVQVYRVDLPLYEGSYKWSGGKSVDVFDSTVVEIVTDAGIHGYGEVCPLGPVYLPSYAAGARAGIERTGTASDWAGSEAAGGGLPAMDRALKGHPTPSRRIDMACWDLLGKARASRSAICWAGGLGTTTFSTGRFLRRIRRSMAKKVAGYRAEGYRRFQLKVGGDPDTDIERINAVAALMQTGDVLVADANTGWLTKDAARVVRGGAGCGRVHRAAVRLPTRSAFRSAGGPTTRSCSTNRSTMCPELLRAINDRAMDVINVKISKFGGISKAREVRDLCVALGSR